MIFLSRLRVYLNWGFFLFAQSLFRCSSIKLYSYLINLAIPFSTQSPFHYPWLVSEALCLYVQYISLLTSFCCSFSSEPTTQSINCISPIFLILYIASSSSFQSPSSLNQLSIFSLTQPLIYWTSKDDMGGLVSHHNPKKDGDAHGRSISSRNDSVGHNKRTPSSSSSSYFPNMSGQPSLGHSSGSSQSTGSALQKKLSIKKKYAFIPDNFSSLEQVCDSALLILAFQYFQFALPFLFSHLWIKNI